MAGGCRKKPSAPPPRPAPSQPADNPTTSCNPSFVEQSAHRAADWFLRTFCDLRRWRHLGVTVLRAAGQAGDEMLTNPMAHIRAADRALACGQTDLAIGSFARAAEMAGPPEKIEALRGLAVALVAGRRYRQVVGIYGQILALAPGDETARFNLGLSLMRLRRLAEADETFRALLTGRMYRTKARFNLATVLAAQGKLAQAAEQLKALVGSHPPPKRADLAAAYAQLAQVLIDMGKTQEAMDACAAAAGENPNDLTAWVNLAAAARSAGSYGYAVTAARKATKLAPFNAETWLYLGDLLLELHRKTGQHRFLAEAVRAWGKSLKVDPSQAALRRRIVIYARVVPQSQPASGLPHKPQPLNR